MSLPELPEPEAYMFQHEETGNTMFVDRQQVEWGFEKNNPRLQRVSEVYTADQMRAYALQAMEALRREPMTEKEMEDGRGRIFSVNNPYCPCDRKTFSKVARYVESHHHITPKEHVSQQRNQQKAMTLQEADEDFELDNYEIDGQGE